jgi:hypothetical protein
MDLPDPEDDHDDREEDQEQGDVVERHEIRALQISATVYPSVAKSRPLKRRS